MEPLQDVPLLNLVLHWAVFILSTSACVASILIWRRERTQAHPQLLEAWKLVAFGLFFYAVSEYSDLYTPGLKASLGVHNYFTEGTLLVGIVFIFIAIRRLVVHLEATDTSAAT